ncbi:RNA polymerase sigma factor [Parabacteroides sp. OttesenSCG-928-O15]|nr:RNA polymerase sigma factor [Parabacteroides sp. OttesenSCG-928-O15]
MTALQFQTRLLGLQDNLFSFALSLTANKEDAMDLVQDTTLKVLDNRERFVDNTNFKGWVMTVMRNIFINNYNRVVRTNTIIDASADLYNVDTITHSGFDTPEGFCDIHEINRAIERLNEEMKTPFALYVSGYKYDEIADLLDIPMGTVKSRIFAARHRLQKELSDYHFN